MKSDDATLKAYAQYLVKWVQAFQDQGINVEIVSPQNEPNYQQNYPSCHWDTPRSSPSSASTSGRP
jgi:glucosylceramidase